MKMVKSLLLGSAAGLVAVGGAQAADLPVKAKPVEYVKVCSLYGAGYYYIPGTDICMHIGGYVRQEWGIGYGDNLTAGPWVSTSMQNTRLDDTRNVVWRTRAYITTETRQQTAYGTLRTYLNIGINGNNSSDFSANRAFIQIAGFTVGLASSYFDHYSAAAVAYLVDQSSDTGDGGQRVFAYTAQLGNGFSATLSLEEPEAKRAGVWNTSIFATNLIGSSTAVAGALVTQPTMGPALGIGGTAQAMQDQAGSSIPDIVGNVRVDGAWGSAQVMGALHEVSGGYLGQTKTGSTAFGRPEDRTFGWAAGVGVKLNAPFIGPGDYFAAQFSYAQGATRYVSNTPGSSGQASFNGQSELGYGFFSDAVYCGQGASAAATAALNTACSGFGFGINPQLTTAWGIAAAYEHFWTPSLRSSLHGHYVAVEYNSTANAAICGAQSVAGVNGANTISFAAAGASGVATCNNNFQMWQIGSRTQWNITKDFYVGFDVIYAKLETASAGAVVSYSQLGGSAQPTGLRTVADQDVIAGRLRWHRDLP
jgi:porin-like protein